MSDADQGEHVKTVYAHFGLAVYLGQVLEHGVVNALFVLDLVPKATSVATKETWSDVADSYFDRQFRKTLGRMINSFKEVTVVPPKLEEHLSRALERRNWLVHHYFRERSVEFMSSAGRERMIAELEEYQQLFEKADKELDRITKPLLEKYGYTEERLAAVREKMLRGVETDL